ncbi:hypothetical protein IAR50_005055 [Cryptococcus sp. DSM 104548]
MKQKLHDSEGLELMVMMMKEKRLARTLAFRVLNYALQSPAGAPSCVRFVFASALPTFFSAFMGKGNHKTKNRHLQTCQVEDEEHPLGILGSLFTNLESDSPERIIRWGNDAPMTLTLEEGHKLQKRLRSLPRTRRQHRLVAFLEGL